MKKSLTTTLAVSLMVLGLAACGGGSGSSTSPTPAPVTPPTTDTGNGGGDTGGSTGGGTDTGGDTGGDTGTETPSPSSPSPSSSTAELIAFAQDGGTTERNVDYTYAPSSTPSQLNRTTRSVTVDGKLVTVTMDALQSGMVGAVTLDVDGERTYRVNEDADVVTDAPDALYVGRAQATYQINADADEVNAIGDATVMLKSDSGLATYETFVSANDGSSVQTTGDAHYANGRFNDMAGQGVIRIDGAPAVVENVRVDGSVIGTRDVNAVMGTMQANNPDTGFKMNGNFMSSIYDYE